MDLSIIIVNHNTREALGRCLVSLQERLPSGIEYEIIVADNASSDGSREYVTRAFPGVSVLALENRGYSTAVNAALRNSRGREILLVNADVEILPEAYEVMSANLAGNPKAGVIGPRHVGPEGNPQLTCGEFPGLIQEIRRKKEQYRLDHGDATAIQEFNRRYAQLTPVDWVSGSCMLLRADVLKDAGDWDENFFLFFEDIDWCRSVQKAGWLVLYAPGASVLHLHGASARKAPSLAEAAYRRSQIYFAGKHFGWFTAFLTRLYLTARYEILALMGRTGHEGGLSYKEAIKTIWGPVPQPNRGQR